MRKVFKPNALVDLYVNGSGIMFRASGYRFGLTVSHGVYDFGCTDKNSEHRGRTYGYDFSREDMLSFLGHMRAHTGVVLNTINKYDKSDKKLELAPRGDGGYDLRFLTSCELPHMGPVVYVMDKDTVYSFCLSLSSHLDGGIWLPFNREEGMRGVEDYIISYMLSGECSSGFIGRVATALGL